VLQRRFECRKDFLGGNVGLDVVNSSENETPARRKRANAIARFVAYVFNRAKRQSGLRIHAGTPKDQVLAVFLLKHRGAHFFADA
jgi:hypothetical protein